MKYILAGAAVAAMFAGAAHATALADLDFDSAFTVDSGVTGSFGPYTSGTATVGAWNASGWSGNIATNTTTGDPASFTSLSLSNLAAHTTVSASFVLGFLDSWDSYNGAPSPDNLEIWLDGTQIANLTYNNASGSITDIDSGALIAQYVQADNHFFYSDTLVGFNYTWAHTASTLTLGFRASGAGWQGGDDESWGIDNIHLTYANDHGNGVPEPATWALMLGGFGLAGAALRRRRAAVA